MASCAVVRARLNGELSTAVGRSSSGSVGQPPAQRLRLGAAGVRQLDVGVADVELQPAGARTAAPAASATLPMLSPCRTSQITDGPGSCSPTCTPAVRPPVRPPDAGSRDARPPKPSAPPGRMTRVTLPTDLPVLAFADQAALEAWLEAEHATAPGLYVKLAKKGAGVPSVNWEQMVEVAALLRLDRRPRQPARRPVLPAADHSPAGAERLVAEERRRRWSG